MHSANGTTLLSAFCPDLKPVERACTLPEASGSAPQEIDPSRENEVLFTYSVDWKVGVPTMEPHCVLLRSIYVNPSSHSLVHSLSGTGEPDQVGLEVGHLPDHE